MHYTISNIFYECRQFTNVARQHDPRQPSRMKIVADELNLFPYYYDDIKLSQKTESMSI